MNDLTFLPYLRIENEHLEFSLIIVHITVHDSDFLKCNILLVKIQEHMNEQWSNCACVMDLRSMTANKA